MPDERLFGLGLRGDQIEFFQELLDRIAALERKTRKMAEEMADDAPDPKAKKQ